MELADALAALVLHQYKSNRAEVYEGKKLSQAHLGLILRTRNNTSGETRGSAGPLQMGLSPGI